MKHLIPVVIAAAVLTLSACGNDPKLSESATPSDAGGVTTTRMPMPTATPTPSQAELSAEAERVYRTFFTEWKRLELAGGADEPTQILRDNGDSKYLEAVMELLREQKAIGLQINPPPTTTRVRPEPGGDYSGVDPRLTLRVCEDGSASTHIRDGKEERGYPVEGKVYLGYVAGRMKVLGASTHKVAQCSFTGTPTPSQAELSAEAERVYRTFFTEWKRLELAGGADEPTQILRDNGHGRYLDEVMQLLREQRAIGIKILPPATTTRVQASPGGDDNGIDPRLTLKVCEDGSEGVYIRDGKEGRGYLVEGKVYFGHVDGRIKVIAGSTRKVERCSF